MEVPKNKSNKLIKVLKISGITLGSVAALLYITPHFFKDTITKSVNEIAKDYVKSKVSFESVNLSFYKHFPNLTVTLDNSKIGASEHFPNQNFIEAKEIALGIDLFSLFGDKITFNQLYLNKAEIFVKTDSLGNQNFDIFISDEEQPKDDSSTNLAFDKILVTNTNLLYADEKTKVKLQATNLSYDGLVNFINNKIDLVANASIEKVLFSMDDVVYIDQKSLKGDLNTSIDLNDLALTFNKDNWVLEKFPFSVNGKIAFPENEMVFDLHVTSINNKLVDLLSVVPKSYQSWYDNTTIEGNSNINFSLVGKLNDSLKMSPNLNLDVQVSNGLLNYKKGPHPIKNLSFDTKILLPNLNPDSLKISVSDFNFNLNEGFAKGNLNYIAPTTIQSKINAKLDLGTLKQASGLDKFDMKGLLELDGEVNGTYREATRVVGLQKKKETYIASIPTINLVSKLTNGYFKMKELPAAVEAINANVEIKNTDGNYKNTSVLIHQLNAKSLNNYIEGYAKIENLNNFKMQTNLKAKVNLAEITSIYPVESVALNGMLDVNFKANGTYEPKRNIFPVSNSHIKLSNGFIKHKDFAELPIEDISIETYVSSSRGSMSDLMIQVLPISFKLAGEPFKLDANLYNFNNLTYNVNSKGKLNLGDIYKLFAIEGYNVNGIIKADLDIRGKGSSANNSTINNRGYLDLENIYLSSDIFPESFIIKNGKLRFRREKIVLDNIKAKYANNFFKITGDVSNYMNFALKDQAVLSGNVMIETNKLNVDEFMVFNESASSSSSKAAPANSGVIMVPSNFNISFDAKAKKVLFNNIELLDFNGKMSVQRGNVYLNDTNFNLIGSPFHMTGSYEPVTTKLAKFDYKIKANNFDIQKAYNEIAVFKELASAAKDAYGNVSVDYNLKGTLDANMSPKMKTISGFGVLTLEDIQFKGFKLFNQVAEKTSTKALHDSKVSKVDIKTSIANNVMTIERTKFKIAGFRPRIEGQVTLDGKMNLGFRLGLPPFGIVGIPMTITGNADDFKVKVGKYHEENLDETDDDFEAYKKSIEVVKDSIKN